MEQFQCQVVCLENFHCSFEFGVFQLKVIINNLWININNDQIPFDHPAFVFLRWSKYRNNLGSAVRRKKTGFYTFLLLLFCVFLITCKHIVWVMRLYRLWSDGDSTVSFMNLRWLSWISHVWCVCVSLISVRSAVHCLFLTIKQKVSVESSTHFWLYGVLMLIICFRFKKFLVATCFRSSEAFVPIFSSRARREKWDNHLLCSWITSFHVSFLIQVFVFMSTWWHIRFELSIRLKREKKTIFANKTTFVPPTCWFSFWSLKIVKVL